MVAINGDCFKHYYLRHPTHPLPAAGCWARVQHDQLTGAPNSPSHCSHFVRFLCLGGNFVIIHENRSLCVLLKFILPQNNKRGNNNAEGNEESQLMRRRGQIIINHKERSGGWLTPKSQ